MQSKAPRGIAFILDGNRRWAKDKGLPSIMGHKAGFEKLEECMRWVSARGIAHIAAYIFSTENWQREEGEVAYLMDLFRDVARYKAVGFQREGVALRFVGKMDLLPEDLRNAIVKIEASNPNQPRITLWVCISYGARAEIAAAACAAAASGESITEASLRKNMWSADMPDPDIIIRTGGEQRLSNFLLWQAAYSELFFIDDYWPDFSEHMLDEVLIEYAERERRMGR
jgi:undecaprenyl diphosphate synthase